MRVSEEGKEGNPQYYLPVYRDYGEATVDLKDIYTVLRSYLRDMIIIGTLCVLSSVALALLLPPTYEATATLAPASASKGLESQLSQMSSALGRLSPLAALGIGDGNQETQQTIAVLQSRWLTEKFIKDNNLLPLLFDDIWDAEAKKWDVDSPEDAPTLWHGYKIFHEEIRSVTLDTDTGLVFLRIEWRDPAQAAAWVNDLIRRVNEHMRAKAAAEAERSLAYLQQQVEIATVAEVRNALFGLIEEKIKLRTLIYGREEYALEVIDPPVVAPLSEPVKPVKILVVGGGILVGIILALAYAFLQATLRKEAPAKGA
jgi:uncharacterized protein involved in exopolysaccharide biosynthesis